MKPVSAQRQSVARRILGGFGSHIYGQVVILVIQLAGVPILLHFWGVELYGEWLILSAIPTYLSLTDLGFTQSAANDMTARFGRGDQSGAIDVFQSLIALVGIVAILGLFAITVAVLILPVGNWLDFSSITPTQAQFIIWLLAAEVLVKLIDGANHAGFRSQGEYALHFFIYYSTLFIQHISLWAVVYLGHGPVEAAWGFFIVRIISVIGSSRLLQLRHPVLSIGVSHARFSTLRVLIRPALANILVLLALDMNIQGMTIVVGMLLGPAAVVTFNTLRTLTRLADRMVQSVTQAVEPEFARAIGANDQAQLGRLFTKTLGYEILLAFGSASFLIAFGDAILSLWTNNRVAMDEGLFGWLLASIVASVFWANSLGLLKAANQHLRAAAWYVLASAMAVAAAVIILRLTDVLTYVGISVFLIDVLMIASLSKQASGILGIPVLTVLKQAVKPRDLVRPLMIHCQNAHLFK